VFKAVVEREGLADRFFIDSCGTGGGNADWYRTEDPRRGWSYHEGDAAGLSFVPYPRRMSCAHNPSAGLAQFGRELAAAEQEAEARGVRRRQHVGSALQFSMSGQLRKM